jgi:hypothetical protein
MSNTPIRPDKKRVLDEAVYDRRRQQYEELKKWDLGHTTGLQCIENIIELEKIIFLGNKLKQRPMLPEGKK